MTRNAKSRQTDKQFISAAYTQKEESKAEKINRIMNKLEELENIRKQKRRDNKNT